MITKPLVQTDDEYSDVMHAIAQCITDDRDRAIKLREAGEERLAVAFDEQVARFDRLRVTLETRYDALEDEI